MKRHKKITIDNIRKKQQKELHELWKKYCRERDKVCQLCGGDHILQVHHIFSRGQKRLFTDVQNGILLCRDCHMSVTNNDGPRETVRRKIDPDVYDRLYEQSLIKGPFLEWKSISWLETQIKILSELLQQLKSL